MDYNAFKLFSTEFLWRTGDAVFAAHFDDIVDAAEAMINNKIYAKENFITLEVPSQDDTVYTLPTDYRKTKSITINGTKPFTSVYATVQYLPELEQRNNRSGIRFHEAAGTFHTINGQDLKFTGTISAENPLDFTLRYYQKLVTYKDATGNFFRDDYPDLYEAAFYYRASKFLKDPEAAAGYMADFDKAIDDVKEATEASEWASPIYVQLPGQVR